MIETIFNAVFLRDARAKMAQKKFVECLNSELAEEFLQLLLNLMRLVFYLDKDFRRNIKDFKGSYFFKSRDNSITVSAVFDNGTMKVFEKEIDNPNITVFFKDSKALMNYLLSPKPDILGSMLSQDVTLNGNLNYLYKFAYMAKHLQLSVTGKI